MEIKNFTITKRDGSQAQFSLDKIMNAIVKAFDSVQEPAELGTISKILRLGWRVRGEVKDNQKHLGIPEVKIPPLKNPNLLCLQV